MPEQSILEEARKAVTGGDRVHDYGHPADNFALTGLLWSAVLGVDISPERVGLLNILQKVAREANNPKRDNLVDIAGYAETIQMVHDRPSNVASSPAPSRATIRSPAAVSTASPLTENWTHYPDIVDGDGDTWEFHHLYRGVPQYRMQFDSGVPRSEEEIRARHGLEEALNR